MRNISFVGIMLWAAFGCGGVAVAGSDKDTRPEADSISKWIGSYESVSGRCGELLIQESQITWGSCKEASAKLISVSASKLVMEIDPSANECGWAGFMVALGHDDSDKSQAAAPGISISAYQSSQDYKTKNRFVQCSYFKKES